MIRMISAAGFALAVATSAHAMTPAPLAQPERVIVQVREGCGMGRVMVNGVCSREPRCAKSTEPTADARDTREAFALPRRRQERC
jgi:hypothetical protein